MPGGVERRVKIPKSALTDPPAERVTNDALRNACGPANTVGVVNAESDMVPAKPLLVRVIVEKILAPGRVVAEAGMAVIEKSGTTVIESMTECERELVFPERLRL